jgi:hypothetical protein
MTVTTCRPTWAELGRADRRFITWPVENMPQGATATVSLEAGAAWALQVSPTSVTGYFAGPDFTNPTPAHVVPVTSHAEIRIVTTDTSETFDGGYIQLVP